MGQCRSKVSEVTGYKDDGVLVVWSHVLPNFDSKKCFTVKIVYEDEARLNYKKRHKYKKSFQKLMNKIENHVTINVEEQDLQFKMNKTVPLKSNEHLDINEFFDGTAGSKRKITPDYNSDSSDEEGKNEMDEDTTITKTICDKPDFDGFIPIRASQYIDIHKQKGNGCKHSAVTVQKEDFSEGSQVAGHRSCSLPNLSDKQSVSCLEKEFHQNAKTQVIDSGYVSIHYKSENHFQSVEMTQKFPKCRSFSFRNSQNIENKTKQNWSKNNNNPDVGSERRDFHSTSNFIRRKEKHDKKNAISRQARKDFSEYYIKLLKDFFKHQNLEVKDGTSFPDIEYEYIKKFDEYLSRDHSLSSLGEKEKGEVFKLLSLGAELARYDHKYTVYPMDGLQKYFDEMSVPVSSRPPHAETMRYEWVRVRSFWSFPSNIRVSPLAMARVGFYFTGKSTECRCFSCGVVRREWRDGDDPYVIHQQISPNCLYMNGQESRNVPVHEEDRLRPRHHVDQTLVLNTAPTTSTTAGAEAILLPGLSSEEIARIPVYSSAASQGRSLQTSQNGDFSFKPQSSQADPSTKPPLVNQGLPSTLTQTPQNSQNVELLSTLQSTSIPHFQGDASFTQGISTQSQHQSGVLSQGFGSQISGGATATKSVSTTTASIQLPTLTTRSLTQPPVTSESIQSSNLLSSLSIASTTTGSTAGSTGQQASITNTTSRLPNNTRSSTTEPPTTTNTTSSTTEPQTSTTISAINTGASSSTTVGFEASRSRFDPLGINFEKPRYPAYAVLTLRVNTYNGWPSYLDQTPRDMAKAGFFYAGYGDYTRCFFCGGGLRNWEAGDDPWVEHARWFPKCAFVRQNRGDSFVNYVQTRHQQAASSNQQNVLPRQPSVLDEGRPANIMASIPVQTLREMGKDDAIITEAIDRWRAAQHEAGQTSNYTELQATEIYEVILEIENERTSSSVSGQQLSLVQESGTPQTTGQQLSLIGQSGSLQSSHNEMAQTAEQLPTGDTNEQVTGAQGEQLPEYLEGFDKILEEYEERKETLTCKICIENPVAVAFLPCGHLVCCLDCAPAMRKCPICQELVKGTIKTFFP